MKENESDIYSQTHGLIDPGAGLKHKQSNNTSSEHEHDHYYEDENVKYDDDENSNSEMPSDLRQSPVNRHVDTHSQTPLLHTGNGTANGNGQQTRLSYDSPRIRPTLPKKHSNFREQDPSSTAAAAATRKRYTYAAVFLAISLVSFAIQTETAVYIQHNLHWKKAYCML